MLENKIAKLMKHLLIYVAVILSVFTIFQTRLLAGGLQPLPNMQKAIEEIMSLHAKEDLIFLADKEYQVQKYYYQVQSKTQKLDVLKEVKGHFEKAVAKAEEIFETGEEEVSQSAITKLKLGLAGTLNDIIELESEIKLARLSLATIFKDNSFSDRKMLDSRIEPSEFKFMNYAEWFKVSGLVFTSDINEVQYSGGEIVLKKRFYKSCFSQREAKFIQSEPKNFTSVAGE